MPRDGIEPPTRGFSVLKSQYFQGVNPFEMIDNFIILKENMNYSLLVAVSQNEVVFGRLGHNLGTKKNKEVNWHQGFRL